MVEIASRADAGGRSSSSATRLPLPFADGSFDRVFTGHFYGHLQPGERERIPRRGAAGGGELVVADSALRAGRRAGRVAGAGAQRRLAPPVYKRYFTG